MKEAFPLSVGYVPRWALLWNNPRQPIEKCLAEGMECIAAELNDMIVEVIIISPGYVWQEGVSFTDTLVVDKNLRGKGIGSKLLDEAIE